MKNTKVIKMPRLLAACAVLILIAALATTAWAADVGGIRRTVQVWIHGDQTDAVLEIENDKFSQYSLTYTDAEGNEHERGGGGVAIDFFGRERPLTEAEILEQLNDPELEFRDDGAVWLYYYGQALDITDRFDEDGVCYVQLVGGEKTLYVTVKRDGGMAYGPHGYVDPKSFN